MADRTITYRFRGIATDYQKALRGMSQSTKAFGGQLATMARTNKQHMDAIGVAAMGVGAAAAYGLKQAADASISFESSFAGVRKTVDASEAEFAKLSAGFRNMATDIPVTVEELNGIGEAAGQLGISKEHILGFSRTMADLGASTNMASEEAATSLARLANITGMPEESFDRLGSTIVSLGNNLATTESEIVEMGLRLAGAGAQVGMTEADILSFAGVLSSVGIEAEAGGSAISKVMIEIASQVANGGDKLEMFASTAGMSAEQFSAAYRDDATGAIISFVEGLGSMEAQGGSTLQTLEALGITEVRMRDALLRTSGAGDQLRQSIELGNQAWKENSALTKEAEQRYGTTASKIAMARNAVNDLLITVGDSLSPVIGAAADSVAGFAGAVGTLPGPLLQVGSGLTALTSAAALGGGAFLLLVPRIVATRDAMQELNITKATSLARMKAMARFMMGPWGLAMAAGAGAMYAWQQAAAGLDETITDMNASVAEAAGNSQEALKGIREAFEERSESAGFMEDVGRAVRQMIGGITLGTERAEVFAAAVETAGSTSATAALDLIKTAEAAELVRIEADGSVSALSHMGDATALTAMEMVTLGAAQEKQARDANAAAGMWSSYGIAAQGAAASVEGLNTELGEGATLADQVNEAFERLAGGTITVERATISYHDQLARTNEMLAEHGSNLDVTTEKGRENRGSVLDLVESIHDHIGALAEDGRTMEEMRGTFDTHINDFRRTMKQAGLTEEQIDALITTYGLTPDQVLTKVATEGVEKAKSDVRGFRGEIEGIGDSLQSITGRAYVDMRAALAGAGIRSADGNLLDFYANGGMRENHVAQIAPAGAYRVWAEQETPGEALIPLVHCQPMEVGS